MTTLRYLQPPGQPPGQPPVDSHHHSQPPDLTGHQLVDNSACDINVTLPNFQLMASPRFHWGLEDPSVVIQSLESAYDETIHWRRNCFTVPNGSAGKGFVRELTRLFHAIGEGSALECIALKAVFVACILLLQKPSQSSKAKEHATHLESRLSLWHDGNITELVTEGCTIQQHLPYYLNQQPDTHLARSFSNLMFEGKTKAALKLITGHKRGSLLKLNDPVDSSRVVRDVLLEKHPPAQPLFSECLIDSISEPPSVHPIVFDDLRAPLIRSAALRTFGAAGPSGVDAKGWHRICTSFHSASNDLCEAMALFARHVCTTFMSPNILTSFVACRLIALDKCPGIHPIGVCEVVRRIISKAALFVIRNDIQEVAGSRQLCAGQLAGVESAVHAVQSHFTLDDTEGILLVDASNAFNALNRIVALHNIRHICPPLATILMSCYRSPAALYISGDVLYSQEGTTQGDPLAMPMYALATLPLIARLPSDVFQAWYADDA